MTDKERDEIIKDIQNQSAIRQAEIAREFNEKNFITQQEYGRRRLVRALERIEKADKRIGIPDEPVVGGSGRNATIGFRIPLGVGLFRRVDEEGRVTGRFLDFRFSTEARAGYGGGDFSLKDGAQRVIQFACPGGSGGIEAESPIPSYHLAKGSGGTLGANASFVIDIALAQTKRTTFGYLLFAPSVDASISSFNGEVRARHHQGNVTMPLPGNGLIHVE